MFTVKMPLEMALHLVYVYNAALSIGHFPSPWKSARVVMIPKKESASTINDYRPISLLEVPGKIFEKLLNQRVAKHMEDGQLYNSFQFGFRSRRGCQDAIALGYEHMAQEKALGRFVRVVLRDVKAAFDKVWHTGVQTKIQRLGLQPLLTATLHDFFRQRTAKIVHKTAYGRCPTGLYPVTYLI